MCSNKKEPPKKKDEKTVKKNLNNEEYIDYIFNKIVSEWRVPYE